MTEVSQTPGRMLLARMASDVFARASNKLCSDTRLSHNAKGVWVAIMTTAEDTPITIDTLAKKSADGRHAVRSGLNELIRYGYLIRGTRIRNHRGQLGHYTYLITDLPRNSGP